MTSFDDIVEAMNHIPVRTKDRWTDNADRLRVILPVIAQALESAPDVCRYCGGTDQVGTYCPESDRHAFECDIGPHEGFDDAADFVREMGK